MKELDWEAEIYQHIENLKIKEEEYRRSSDDSRLSAEMIQKARLDLESHIYKAKKRLEP